MSMRALFFLINVVGGIAVLGSYAWGLATQTELRAALWGNVPTSLRPFYTAFMFLAAAGYFAFSSYILRYVEPGHVRLFGRYEMGFVILVYVLVLVPSALWMPLTFSMLESPTTLMWWGTRAVLLTVGLASLTLFLGLLQAGHGTGGLHYWLAVGGAAAFTVQTLLLDALIWPAYFPR